MKYKFRELFRGTGITTGYGACRFLSSAWSARFCKPDLMRPAASFGLLPAFFNFKLRKTSSKPINTEKIAAIHRTVVTPIPGCANTSTQKRISNMYFNQVIHQFFTSNCNML